MPIQNEIKLQVDSLKREYDSLKKGKEALLDMIFESELPESVYNSNAIENSTLTILETEKILMEMEVSRNLSLREVFEAKNLGRVFEFIKTKIGAKSVDADLILLLHKMLILNINDEIAGRFRGKNEFVRVGTHVAPAPEVVESLLEAAMLDYSSDYSSYFIEKISRFHLEFEHIHPFIDGNGRIGRVLINYMLMQTGFPPVIIRDKEKAVYYSAFGEYKSRQKTATMEKVIYLALMESLHKRITYLKGDKIVRLTEFARKSKQSVSSLLNKAKRQTIPAFREKGVWKIGSRVKVLG